MSQRIGPKQLDFLAARIAIDPKSAGLVSPEVAHAAILDLFEARNRIAELEILSASQEEAMQAFERGSL